MKIAITGLAALHLLVTLWHGYAHTRLEVTLPPEQNAFVFLVVILAPLAGLLVWTRYLRIGVWIFSLSMLGSFLFGTYHHFVVVSADHILHLPNGSAHARSAFIASAAGLALIELVSTLYGALCLQKTRA